MARLIQESCTWRVAPELKRDRPAADSVIVPVTEGARSVRSTKDWNAVLPRAESQPVDEVLGLHVPLKTATRLVDAAVPVQLVRVRAGCEADTYTWGLLCRAFASLFWRMPFAYERVCVQPMKRAV